MRKKLIYKSVDGRGISGDLYSPTLSGLKPAVIVVHGGGWTQKSGDMENVCKSLVKAGFVVFRPDYRLAPKNIFPSAVDDIKDAIKWMKDHAIEYEIDPNRIAGWGYSAGGNLILLAGLNPELGLKAIVSGGTPSDLTAWPNSPLVRQFIGSSLEKAEAMWKLGSPINHVDKNSPPVFLYHGEWDVIVDAGQMEKMRKALTDKKRTVETYTASFMGHLAVYFFSQESVNRGVAFIARELAKTQCPDR